MSSSSLQYLSKTELARSQVEVALRLYLSGDEFPAAITLAGAAEEILGKIAEQNGFESSLKRTLRELLAGHKRIWGEDPIESDYAKLRNRAKNEMKHICSGENIQLDLEREAALLLARAFENFLLCTGSAHPGQIAFVTKRVADWRKKQNNLAAKWLGGQQHSGIEVRSA